MYILAVIFFVIMLFIGISIMRQADKDYKEYQEYDIKGGKKHQKTGRILGCIIIIAGMVMSSFSVYTENEKQQQKHEFNAFVSKNYEKFDTLEEARSAFAIQQAKQAYKKYLKENSL